jgi:hypothetical protein
VETLMMVAFVLGPVLGVLALPLAAGLLAFSFGMRSWLLGGCLAVAGGAWVTWFVLWGEAFAYANRLVDTPTIVLAAYDASTVASSVANLVLIGVIGSRLRRESRSMAQSNNAGAATVTYGP